MRKITRFAGRLFLKFTEIAETLRIEDMKSRLLSCGTDVKFAPGCDLIPEHLEVGSHVYLGRNTCIKSTLSTVHIGSHVSFGPNVTIRGGDHRVDIVGRYMDTITEEEKMPENDQDVYIQDDVWIGGNVVILKGVTIGEGSVIGAGSVVTRDVPPYTIHVGVHEPYEKKRFTEEELREHRRLLAAENPGLLPCEGK